MLTQVRFQYFRCLQDVTIRLSPLTVFVGPNASGKTAVLSGFQHGGWEPQDPWQKRSDIAAKIAVEFTDDSGRVSKRPNPKVVFQSLRFDVEQLRAPRAHQEARLLGNRGEGLVSIFATLTRKRRDEVAREYCSLVTCFSDVDERPLGGGAGRLVFQDRWNEDVWYEPNEVSDGSILMLAFLLLREQRPSPDLITIEEPERGLHPYLMNQLVQMLRSLTTGRFGKPIQVLLATQSPEFLDCLDPDEVRFLRRSRENGSVEVLAPETGDPLWSQAFKEYRESLGAAWLSGALGGVPGV